jgi:hypothetical protein
MRARTLITLAATVGALLFALAGCGSSSSNSSSSATSSASSAGTATSSAATSTASASSTTSGPQIGFEAVPLEQGPDLASASTTQPAAVDGIQCKPSEQLVYHIHAHLAVFDNGRLYALPGGIGIPGSQDEQSQYGPVAVGGQCYFWLHTHTADGVIHVESPERAIFTLGDFFDVWRQPLTAERIASLRGKVSAFVNGKPWHKSVRAIPLLPHADIQLEIGEPIPPIVTVNWKKTGL